MKTLLDGYGSFTTVYLVIKKKLSREVLITRSLAKPYKANAVDYLTQELVFLGSNTTLLQALVYEFGLTRCKIHLTN
jgi:hypothetical protein